MGQNLPHVSGWVCNKNVISVKVGHCSFSSWRIVTYVTPMQCQTSIITVSYSQRNRLKWNLNYDIKILNIIEKMHFKMLLAHCTFCSDFSMLDVNIYDLETTYHKMNKGRNYLQNTFRWDRTDHCGPYSFFTSKRLACMSTSYIST